VIKSDTSWRLVNPSSVLQINGIAGLHDVQRGSTTVPATYPLCIYTTSSIWTSGGVLSYPLLSFMSLPHFSHCQDPSVNSLNKHVLTSDSSEANFFFAVSVAVSSRKKIAILSSGEAT